MTTRAKTAEEVRAEVLRHVRFMATYWAGEQVPADYDVERRLHGFAHSILAMIDGEAAELPAIDLVLRPHPDDKRFHQDCGEMYYEDGQVINDCALHELYHAQRS